MKHSNKTSTAEVIVMWVESPWNSDSGLYNYVGPICQYVASVVPLGFSKGLSQTRVYIRNWRIEAIVVSTTLFLLNKLSKHKLITKCFISCTLNCFPMYVHLQQSRMRRLLKGRWWLCTLAVSTLFAWSSSVNSTKQSTIKGLFIDTCEWIYP